MRFWSFVGAVIALSLIVTVSAQNQKSTPATKGQKQQSIPSTKSADDFEVVHQDLFKPKVDKAAEASKLTEGFTAAGAALSGDVPLKNYIDQELFGRMQRDKVPHASLAGDEEFMRRVYLDATGLLPTPAQVREFVASEDANKRDALIDSLIGSDVFAEQWAWMYMDLFQSRSESFAYWLRQSLKLDRPYNEVFADLVGGPASKSHNMIPTWGMIQQPSYNSLRAPSPTDQDNYFLENRLDFIDEVTVNFGRVFLGINMDCISCHDGAGHTDSINLYLTDRKRSDFHQQAAFLGRLRNVATWSDRARNISNANLILDDSGPGYTTGNDAPFVTMAEARFPRDGKTYEPAFILTGEKPKPGVNPRQELGRIMPAHIQFSRAAVNLIWSKLMVVGFVEPYDGFDLNRLDPNNVPKGWTVQPTNPALLEKMAKDFKENHYSMHHLFKTIMKSSSYQLSTRFPGEWKDAYTPYYARKFVRVLSGPEIADVLAQVTARPYDFELMGQKVTRVKQLASPTARARRQVGAGNGGIVQDVGVDGNAITALMQAFYQSTRETPPASSNRTSAVQSMLMMSSPAVRNRVRAENGSAIQQLLNSGKSDSEVIEELFLSTLSRRPTKGETEVALRLLEKDRRQGGEDIQWALLNTAEFLLNH